MSSDRSRYALLWPIWWRVDGEDDDHSRYYLRSVLVAAAYNHFGRRFASKHLEVSFIITILSSLIAVSIYKRY